MTRPRFFFPEVRLKRLLAEPGGVSASEALNRAEEAIESVRASCLVAIDAKIAAIATYVEGSPELTRRCYVLANEIYAEAGALGLSELSNVSHNLCELLSLGATSGVPRPTVMVHADAMRALRSPAISANQQLRAAVVAELHHLTARFARTP
jgi:hypothetical protein